jgi:hypothetical protein
VSSVFANTIFHLVLMIDVAAISGRVVVVSISKEDATKAWLYTDYFVVSSFMVAWFFWRLV